MTIYHANVSVPFLVQRALNLADQMGSPPSCSFETGRLLQLLAGQHQSGVIGEISTNCGVGAAWIASALSPGTSFFTVEEDPTKAAAVRALFDTLLNVRVILGDWREFLQNWRFGMLYACNGSERDQDPDMLLQALGRGGMIILDGLTPVERLPLEMRNDPDPVREIWLNDSRIRATEVRVSSDESVILATRIASTTQI